MYQYLFIFSAPPTDSQSTDNFIGNILPILTYLYTVILFSGGFPNVLIYHNPFVYSCSTFGQNPIYLWWVLRSYPA